jgi:hypothetical protein
MTYFTEKESNNNYMNIINIPIVLNMIISLNEFNTKSMRRRNKTVNINGEYLGTTAAILTGGFGITPVLFNIKLFILVF